MKGMVGHYNIHRASLLFQNNEQHFKATVTVGTHLNLGLFVESVGIERPFFFIRDANSRIQLNHVAIVFESI